MVLDRWRPRWSVNPWRAQREMEDWERTIDDFFGRSLWRVPTEERGWMPSVDVYEKDDKFVVKAELPGTKEEDIDVAVAGNTLSIKGEKKTETEVNDEDYYRCERTYGSFSRSIPLPSTVDVDKIEANFEDGVLEITLPKSAEVKPKKVAVSAKAKSGTKAKTGKK